MAKRASTDKMVYYFGKSKTEGKGKSKALLGGKGTLWGPVIGAILFHVIKEVTWNYFLGWQWVALGALIVVTVVYFQDGVMGWLMHKYPHWFGIKIEEKVAEKAT